MNVESYLNRRQSIISALPHRSASIAASVVPERLCWSLWVHPVGTDIWLYSIYKIKVESSPNRRQPIISSLPHRSAGMAASVVPERLRRSLWVYLGSANTMAL